MRMGIKMIFLVATCRVVGDTGTGGVRNGQEKSGGWEAFALMGVEGSLNRADSGNI